MEKFHIFKETYPEVNIDINSIEELKTILKDMWSMSFIIVKNNVKIEDDFLYRSEQQLNSINRMTLQELKKEFEDMCWSFKN